MEALQVLVFFLVQNVAGIIGRLSFIYFVDIYIYIFFKFASWWTLWWWHAHVVYELYFCRSVPMSSISIVPLVLANGGHEHWANKCVEKGNELVFLRGGYYAKSNVWGFWPCYDVPSSKTELKLCFEPLAHVLVILESSSEAIFSSTTAAPGDTPPSCNADVTRKSLSYLMISSKHIPLSLQVKKITKAVLFSFRNRGGKIGEPPIFGFPFNESHRTTLNFVFGVIRKKRNIENHERPKWKHLQSLLFKFFLKYSFIT